MAVLPAIAAVAAVVGAGAAVAGGIAQGHAASYQAQVARNNATIANQQAAYAAQAGAVNTERAALKQRAKQAGLRVQLAANGLDIDSGSAAAVQAGAHDLGALDVADVAHKSALDVYGYRTQGGSFKAQASLDEAEAGFAPIAGALKGAGTLASAAPSFGSLLGGTPQVPDHMSWMQDDGIGGWGSMYEQADSDTGF